MSLLRCSVWQWDIIVVWPDTHNLSLQFFTLIHPSAGLLPFAQVKPQGNTVYIKKKKNSISLFFPRNVLDIHILLAVRCTTVFIIDNKKWAANQHIRMISEGSRDTEDFSFDHGNILNSNTISQYYYIIIIIYLFVFINLLYFLLPWWA